MLGSESSVCENCPLAFISKSFPSPLKKKESLATALLIAVAAFTLEGE